MKNVIVSVQHLDQIKKQLVNINTRLDDINDKIILDNWFKVLAILVPIIVGLVIFILTKRKEILFKKAEVAGEIFMRLYNLKKLRGDYANLYLNKCAFEACQRLQTKQSIDIDSAKCALDIDETDKPKQVELKMESLVNELMKYIGQYKFYISKKDKKELERKIVIIHLTHQKYELFENCNSVDEILDKQEKLMLEKLFNNDFEQKIIEMFNEIEKLIGKK
jgi:hypothetical protein